MSSRYNIPQLRLLRIPFDLNFVVHAMLGQYSRHSCYIIQVIPRDCIAGLKFNGDDDFCTAWLSFDVFNISRIDHDHVTISNKFLCTLLWSYYLMMLSIILTRIL